jgi:hypothetical protein
MVLQEALYETSFDLIEKGVEFKKRKKKKLYRVEFGQWQSLKFIFGWKKK